MADSVQVFDAGFRVLDSNGAPVSGAKIKFRLAGPGASMNVYADKDLTSSLGSTVYTRSDGFPVVSSGSSTTTLIYTGTSAYNIEITDADDVPLFPAKDNVRGAIDTSGFLTSSSASTLSISTVNVTSDLTLGATHKGKLINCDPSSSTFTITLTSAVTLGDGWTCEIKHKGTANHVRIYAPENVEGPFGSRNAFSLERGESVLIRCDGATFKIAASSPSVMMSTMGRILIESGVTADPGTVTPRTRYIANAVFTAGGITTAVGDIIEATGQGTFIKYTPPTNCGWIAYIKTDTAYYMFLGSAWTPNFAPANSPTGSVIGHQVAQYTTSTTLSTSTPVDDTIPQVTEGTQIISSSYTPKIASSIIRIRYQGPVSSNFGAGDVNAVAHLHINGGSNAVAASIATVNIFQTAAHTLYSMTMLEYEYSPGSTTAITFSIRLGANGSSIYPNGNSGGRLFGGVAAHTLTIEEIRQ